MPKDPNGWRPRLFLHPEPDARLRVDYVMGREWKMKQMMQVVVAAMIVGLTALHGGPAQGAVPPQVAALSAITEGVNTPLRITTDTAGNVYTADPRGGGILKYSTAGRLLQVIPTVAPPQAVAVTANGSLVVSQGSFAAMLDQAGRELRRLGGGAGQFKMANGIAIDEAGRIYIVDSLNHCVQIFNAAGDYVTRFGVQGSGSGQLNMPTGIAFEKVSRHLAVVDTFNGRIQFFDTNGAFQRTLGSFGSGPLKFTFPLGISFEYTTGTPPALSRVYVTDSFQGNVQALDPTGTGSFLSFVGSYGSGAGQLQTPSDAVFDAVGSRLIVANAVGSLTVFGIGSSAIPIDTTPPVLAINPLPPSTTSASQVVSGTVEAGAVVTVSINGAPALPATVSGTAWNASISLVPGANSITVRGRDAAGNIAIASAAITLAVTGFSVDPAPVLVKVRNITISGSRGSGLAITVANGTTGAIGSVTYPTATTWQASLSGLVEGDNLITVAAAGTSENVTVTVDTLAPVLAVSALKQGSVTGARLQDVTVQVSDPHLGKVTVNGTPAAVANGLASAVVPLGSGVNTITVAAIDGAGNMATDTRSISFDANAPSVAIVAPADGLQTRTSVVELAGTMAPNVTVTVNGTAALVSGTTWSRRVTLVPGLNTVTVAATDLSGKSTTLKRSVLYDPALPEVEISAPAEDTATPAAGLAVSGMVEAGATVAATVNGKPASVVRTATGYTLSLPLDAEGVYGVMVTASDAGGATSVVTRDIIVDRKPPLLLISSPTTPVPAILTGTAGADAVVTATDRSGTVTVLPVAAGTWSLDLGAASLDPATLRVTAADAAGNIVVRTLATPAPTGDLNGDGNVNIADVIHVLKVAVGVLAPQASDFVNGDVGPFVNGKVSPDGMLDLRDVILVLRKTVGVEKW